MKKTKKLLALVLALGMVSSIGLTACGGDKGGDSSSVDTGTAKGEQVTLQEWTTAVTNSFAADNVTMNTFEDMHMEEVWDDGEHMIYEGTTSGVIKLAGNVSYEKNSATYTENGVSATEYEEEYNYVNDGMYYEWSRASADGEWGYHESPYYAGMFDGTIGEVIFGGESFSQELISRYDQLQYDESKGEYSVSVDDEGGQDPATLKIKIVEDKFYTLTIRFEVTAEESPSEYGYVETKYVFVDYGTTSVQLPNEEEEEESGNGESSEEGKTSSSVWQPTAMTEEEWNAAFANTFAAENINISGSSSITARGLTDTATVTSSFADGKAYAEIVYAMGGTERCYLGNVFDESYGYEVPYKWIWDSDTSSWDCAYSDMGVVTAEDAFSLADLGLQGWFSKMNNYSAATYDAEKDCYLVTLEDFNNASLEIAFADGKLASLKVSAVDNVDFVGEMIESSMYTITYGNATVGNLPAVTI